MDLKLQSAGGVSAAVTVPKSETKRGEGKIKEEKKSTKMSAAH